MGTVDYWLDGKLIQIDENDSRANHTRTEEQQKADEEELSKSKENEIRNVRNTLLTETDWTQNADVSDTISAKWKTYRQELRDITNGLTTVEEVNAVVYPEKPEV